MSDLVIPDGSQLLTTWFVVLTLVLVGALAAAAAWAMRRTGLRPGEAARGGVLVALAGAAWLTLGATAAARGVLRFDATPPTMLVAMIVTAALTIWLARSALGARLAAGIPLAVLVGYQGFRVAVEMLLHRAYSEGLMPIQMSYAGRNFDIVSGITALVLGIYLATGRGSERLVGAWNWLGLALLANIMTIAILSAPVPFRTFHNAPANVWVTRAPWVWLPLLMVPMALLGHLLVFRRLKMIRRVTASLI